MLDVNGGTVPEAGVFSGVWEGGKEMCVAGERKNEGRGREERERRERKRNKRGKECECG